MVSVRCVVLLLATRASAAPVRENAGRLAQAVATKGGNSLKLNAQAAAEATAGLVREARFSSFAPPVKPYDLFCGERRKRPL